MVRLGDHIKLIGGGTPSKADKTLWGGEIPWMSVKDLKSDKVDSTVDYITEKGVSNSATNIVPAGSLIIATRMAVGKPVITTFKTAINQDLKAIEVDDAIDKKFLFYFLKNKQKHFESIATGATVKGIKIKAITDLKIPLPPLETQRKIAAILDTADEYRQMTKALIDKYDELAQSLFLDMFGDPVTNPKGWEKVSLGSLTKVSSGTTPSRKRADYYEGTIPWVKTGEVNGDVIMEVEEHVSELALKETSLRLYPENSVIVAMYGQGVTRGKSALLGIKSATNQACAVIEPCDILESFFLLDQLKLRYRELRALGRGGNQANLNVGMIKTFEILVPDSSSQKKYAQLVKDIKFQKYLAQKEVKNTEELFNSLLQKAFKGELE